MFCFAGLLLAIATLAAQENESLQGSWTVVAAERNGKPADDVKGHIVRFTGKTFEISMNGKIVYKGAFRIDPSQKPATIDFQHTLGKLNGKAWKGIFDVSPNKLKICDNAPDITQPRPRTFVTRPDSGLVSVVLERQP